MQLKINFDFDEPFTIPHNYEYQLQSAIYSKLREIGASDFWHDEGFGSKQKFKVFSFSPIMGEYKVVPDNMLEYNGKAYFEVRSIIFEFCDALQRALEKNPCIRLFDRNIKISGIELINRHIHEDYIRCHASSPVVVHITDAEGKTVYLRPEDSNFSEQLIRNFRKKFLSVYGEEAPDVEIIPIGRHKKVVEKYKNFWLTGYKGDYIIRGEFYCLELIYNCGLGEKNSQGFGCINICHTRDYVV